jgi:hypothetical protein
MDDHATVTQSTLAEFMERTQADEAVAESFLQVSVGPAALRTIVA